MGTRLRCPLCAYAASLYIALHILPVPTPFRAVGDELVSSTSLARPPPLRPRISCSLSRTFCAAPRSRRARRPRRASDSRSLSHRARFVLWPPSLVRARRTAPSRPRTPLACAKSVSSRRGRSRRPSQASPSSSSWTQISIRSGSASRCAVCLSEPRRSEGPQPHVINIQFNKRMPIAVRLMHVQSD